MNEKKENWKRRNKGKVEQSTFTILDETGQEVVCEALFSFDSKETGKSYIVYTDNTEDEAGNTRVYASCFYPESDNAELLPIETSKEWEIIETILESLKQSNIE